MFDNLIWSFAEAVVPAIPVYTLLILILDWCRSILFYHKD